MRTCKYSPEQIAQALRQAEGGTPVVEICRKLQITEQTLYRWRKQFGDLGAPEVRELRPLRDENRKLKQLVADLSLDKTILQESLKKNGNPSAATRVGVLGSERVPTVGAACLSRGADAARDGPVSQPASILGATATALV